MVRASRHRRDMTMSVLLLTIVMVFILCNTARVACNLYEAYQVNIYQYTIMQKMYTCYINFQLFLGHAKNLFCKMLLCNVSCSMFDICRYIFPMQLFTSKN